MKGGMLKPDTFSEHRLPGFPPGIYALLITFNRFHNYVAGELERINGSGRFVSHAASTSISPLRSEYTRTILNLNYTPDSGWVLDPRESFSQAFDKVDFSVSTGNQVSVEFNLIYRGHSNVSAKDEKWSQDLF
ncbi:hypothetical protein NW765_015214 [Fusarium oxysporum]|nr:hypothetical protein NW765_015214 [Fusarium oxysporum]KAJ4281082.1 hypothetical protein NW764_005425 [Fusarium oxysporum]